jgi:hypothetical protein
MVAGVLRPESSSETRRFFRFRHVAEVSLAVVLVSFLPLLVHEYGVSADKTWFIASSICLVPASIAPFVSWSQVGVQASYHAEPLRTATSLTLNVVMVSLLLSNLILPGPTSGVRYVTTILLLLALAGLVFLGATFDHRSPPTA